MAGLFGPVAYLIPRNQNPNSCLPSCGVQIKRDSTRPPVLVCEIQTEQLWATGTTHQWVSLFYRRQFDDFQALPPSLQIGVKH